MILLKSDVLEVKGILKKTTAKMFCDLEVGDKIILSIKIKDNKYSGGYANYIRVTNLKTHECVYKSFAQITWILDYFMLEEVKEVEDINEKVRNRIV